MLVPFLRYQHEKTSSCNQTHFGLGLLLHYQLVVIQGPYYHWDFK